MGAFPLEYEANAKTNTTKEAKISIAITVVPFQTTDPNHIALRNGKYWILIQG
jgi:hypothetical protein